MPFEPGNRVGQATRFRPGNVANPGGLRGTGGLMARRQALEAVLEVVEEVIGEPEALESFRAHLRQRWREDPFQVLRNLLPFLPRETLTAQRTIGGTLQTMSISHLRRIAATLPEGADAGDGMEELPALDVPEAVPALPPDMGENSESGAETVTEAVTNSEGATNENAERITWQGVAAQYPSDTISEVEDFGL